MSQLESQEQIAKLIALHLTGDISKDEQALLNQWINGSERNAQLFDRITDATSLAQALQELQNTDTESGLSNVKQRIADERNKEIRPMIHLWPRIAAAASILLFLSIGGYFLVHKSKPAPQTAQNQQHDLAPGRNQATLTLANGQKIILSKGLNGKLAQQGGMLVQVNSGNAIAYTANAAASTANTAVLYNTLSTKRGEQSPYPLILADGTKVWLDAASSITFPTAFGSNERLVKITGQAMLEVAHDPIHPFKVAVRGQIVEDIGTVFNINAYDDEPSIKATLINGEVKVYLDNAISSAVRLKPGQQAILKNKTLLVQQANIEEVSAWHNGLFEFHDADVPTVMRQLARWYDVDVSYEGSIPKSRFSGNIYRNVSALKVSDILSFEKIHFRIEGKKIIVEP